VTHFTRRHFMLGAGGLFLGATGLASYPLAVEPGFRLDLTSYRIRPPQWPAGLNVKTAIIADIHACDPLMSASRVRHIAEFTNKMNPDIIFLLGDFSAGHRFVTGPVYADQWGEALSILRAPLGAHAILGNHDWWHGALPGMRGDGGESVRKALRHADITVLENDCVRVSKDGHSFWVAGLADQLAHKGRWGFRGVDDLDGTLAKVTDDSPVLLLAHEPFVFRRVPERVSLTFCGHTHGGQINLPFITAAYAESEFGTDHIYGHIVEGNRHMIISAGLGTSMLPVRFMRPPEIVQVDIAASRAAET
jgi:uncharacterized protein